MRPCPFPSELPRNFQPNAASGHPASALLEQPGVGRRQAAIRAGADEPRCASWGFALIWACFHPGHPAGSSGGHTPHPSAALGVSLGHWGSSRPHGRL